MRLGLRSHLLEFLVARQKLFFDFPRGPYRRGRLGQNPLGIDNAYLDLIRKRTSRSQGGDKNDARGD